MSKRAAMDGLSAAPGTTTEQAVRILANWCRAQQDEEKKLLLHALEQLKKEMQLDTETEGNWEAAMYVNVAIQKVNLALVANDQLKHPTALALLAKGVREFPAEAFTRGAGATKYYRANDVKHWMNTVMETVNDAI